MTEKRFKLNSVMNFNYGILDGGEEVGSLANICDLLNELDSENKRLKIKNKGLQSELQIFKEDVEYNNKICNKLSEENKQLKYVMNKFKEDILFDIKNDIGIYPKRLMEYWCSVMEKIGD